MSIISDIFSGGASGILDGVGNILDKVVTTKGEKLTLENEIRKAEMQYQVDMKTLDIKEEELYQKDADSARVMNTEVQKSPSASWLSKNIVPLIALFILVLTSTIYIMLISDSTLITDKNRDIIKDLTLTLRDMCVFVISFYFGSSISSHKRVEAELKNKSNEVSK